MHAKRQALGRGLDALLPVAASAPPATPQVAKAVVVADVVKSVTDIDVSSIIPNPYQPRGTFTDESLNELVDSIRAQGIIQPILVRRVDRKFQIVAGERRWRAALLAEKTTVPAIISEPTEQEMLEWALLENIQREDLNAIDEARAYQTLLQEFGLSQEEVASRVGKKRSSVANSLRLLKLDQNIQHDISEGRLSAGHGRAILAITDPALQAHLHDMIVGRSLSVRQAEGLANKLNKRKRPVGMGRKRELKPELTSLAEQLAEHLGTKVSVKPMGLTKGRIEIYYSNLESLDHILELLAISGTS